VALIHDPFSSGCADDKSAQLFCQRYEQRRSFHSATANNENWSFARGELLRNLTQRLPRCVGQHVVRSWASHSMLCLAFCANRQKVI
jgi:hypothetical protein